MRSRIGIGLVVVLASLGASVVGASPQDKDFETLKSLQGEWVSVGEDGKAAEEVTSVWQVTAAGSAVVETLFPGTDHEMMTVYTRDGDDIVLTHYCVAGNAPRMRARASGSGRLDFNCEGGAGLASENDDHMHHATFEWVDDGHIRAEWTMLQDGKSGHTAKFDLVRRR